MGTNSAAARKMWQDPEYRAKQLKARENPEYRAKQLKAREDPEQRAQFRAVMKKRWENPEYRAKQLKAREDPEQRAKLGAAIKKCWEDPDYRAQFRAAIKKRWENDPEYRANQSVNGRAGAKRRWNKEPGAESEVCPQPHTTVQPAFVYVLPLRVRDCKSGGRKGMNKMLREMPRGIFCKRCFQQRRKIIEQAAETLELWNLTREIEDAVKGKRT